MPEQVATPAASVPRDASTTANNIAAAIHNKANGRSQNQAPVQSVDKGQTDTKTPPAVDPNAGKEKYVIEGKEVWLSPEQARAYVQKGIAFEPRVDQLNRLQQEVIQFQQALASNPLAVLKSLAKQRNIPIETLYEKILDGDWPDSVKEIVGKRYYHNAIEPMKLSPEELKAREDAKYRTEHEKKEKERQDDAIRQENHQKVQQALGQLKAFIGEAMKESGLPNNDTPLGAEMARMVADTIRVARRQNQSITPKQAIEHVKKRMKEVQAAYYDHLDDEALVSELGEANAEKVKKYFLKRVQPGDGQLPIIPNKKPAVRNGERKTINMDEFHDQLAELKKKG